jgi:hypothetical protein
MAAHFKSPLTLYVLWHPKFLDGEKLADRLFNTLSRNVDDPFARSIGIPVYYRSKPAGAESAAPAAIPLDESDYNAIVVFVDTAMILSADWKEYIVGILEKIKQCPDKTRVFPMASDSNAFNFEELGAKNFIRLFEADSKDDVGLLADGAAGTGDTAMRELEASLRAREAALAERERALMARESSSGVSFAVGQPAAQGNGITFNITINHADATTRAGDFQSPASAAIGLPSHAEPAGTKSDSPQARSAADVLLRRGNLMISKLVHELCRLILSLPRTTEAGTTRSAKPVSLFLSHAKADGAQIAKEIKNYIEADSSMKTFFDANDIAAGYEFGAELKANIEDAALICIQTDYYATREWCLFEVITAKRFDRPLVVLNAVKEREPRSFPYIGNVPTMRWNPQAKSRFRQVVDMALFEVLANTYNKMFLEALRELYVTMPPGPSVGHAPELFTILNLRKTAEAAGSLESASYVLYPDPPLGDEELGLLQELSPGTTFITPMMLPVIAHRIESK